MRGAAPRVHIFSVGRRADADDFRAERVEHRLCDGERASVGAVQPHPQSAKGGARNGEQVGKIAVAPRDVIDRPPDLRARGERKRTPVDIFLHAGEYVIREFFAVSAEDLDAVILERIVACRDHHAAVESLRPNDIGDGGRRRHVQKVDVRTRSRRTRRERVFERVGGAARILAHCDTHALPLIAGVIPAQKPPHAERVDGSQPFVRLPAESVRSEILHSTSPARAGRFLRAAPVRSSHRMRTAEREVIYSRYFAAAPFLTVSRLLPMQKSPPERSRVSVVPAAR